MKNTEIEHKYLVASDLYRTLATSRHAICQGYLSVDPERTVRVRRSDDSAYMTIKAPAPEGSIARFEWERPLSMDDFNALFPLCLPGAIEKVRYVVPMRVVLPDGTICQLHVEVDEFHGDNEGLVMAEIEIPFEGLVFDKPSFLGEEVTSDPRYYNSYLTQHPFRTW